MTTWWLIMGDCKAFTFLAKFLKDFSGVHGMAESNFSSVEVIFQNKTFWELRLQRQSVAEDTAVPILDLLYSYLEKKNC